MRPHKIMSDQPSLHGHPRLDLELWFETDLQKEKYLDKIFCLFARFSRCCLLPRRDLPSVSEA